MKHQHQTNTIYQYLVPFDMSTEAVPSTVELSDGAKLRVWQLGGTGSTKPLLIAVHGAPGHSSHLEPLDGFGFLHSKYRVLVFDLRGSGESDIKGPFTDERWVQDIDELRCVPSSQHNMAPCTSGLRWDRSYCTGTCRTAANYNRLLEPGLAQTPSF
jgi:predicted alpha/beta-fold hydrolase